MLPLKTYLFIKRAQNKIMMQNNRLKIIAPTWNDKSELPDGSYSVPDSKLQCTFSRKY